MAGVIKAGEAHRGVREVSGFRLGDFIVEGRQVVAAARARAETILAEARAEAARLRDQAHAKGSREGFQKGHQEGRATGHREALEKASAEFQARQVQLASACESLFREVDRRKRELLLSAYRDLIVLAVAIAERVTKRIGRLDPQAVVTNLEGVIDLVGGTADLVVEVSPADAETLERFAPELVARRGDLKHVAVVASEAVEPGGCIVRTRGGRIDSTLQTQLERIAQELVPDRHQTGAEAHDDSGG